MTTRVESIYQSGERVTVQGFYEVAGAPEIQRSFNADDLFPNYDGRAVCWRLAELSQRPSVANVHAASVQSERMERPSRTMRSSYTQRHS